jgi:hypothetical protein
MTDEQRVERLEQYVERLDEDLKEAHQRISKKTAEVDAAAKAREQTIRDEMQERDEQRRDALKPSLRRQLAGAVCVLAGLSSRRQVGCSSEPQPDTASNQADAGSPCAEAAASSGASGNVCRVDEVS